MRILLVEDDPALRETLTHAMRSAGFGIDDVADGRAADTALMMGIYDLVILDLGLPKMDGIEVLRNLRARKDKTAVMVLTARDDIHERVKGLDIGADDYLIKPFALPELEARVRALIRRSSGGDLVLSNGPLTLECKTRQVSFNGEPLDLLLREIRVLEALMQRVGQVVIKSKLAAQMSTWESEIGENAIEVHIHRLRKRLAPYGLKIKTIHGLGYVLETYDEH